MLALINGFFDVVKIAGTSVQIADTNLNVSGGLIINPLSSTDEEIFGTESLYVNLLGPALTSEASSTVRLTPGQTFIVPPGTNVWVNAKTAGHKFSSVFSREYSVTFPPTVVPGQIGGGIGSFPTDSPSGLLKGIPSYLYQEYSDDDDLQGFVEAQNSMQQDYVDTFNELNLPIYTGPIVADALLDWVGSGLYGMARPSIGTGVPLQIGPLNTYAPNWKPWDTPPAIPPSAVNMLNQLSVGTVVVTNDDLYRRILTWHFLKGDGNYFNTRWMKRRIWRFLYGEDGVNPYAWDALEGRNPVPAEPSDAFIADTEQISISIGVNRNVTIRFVLGKRTVTGGAMCNLFGCNGFGPNWGANPAAPANGYTIITLNDVKSVHVPYNPLPYMSTFKAALESGVLETPYQFNFTCSIG